MMKLKLYKTVNKLSSLVGEQLVYYLNASKYVSLVNFILILATFHATYDIGINIFIIILVGLIGSQVLGYIDYTYIMKHQMDHANEKNNILKEIQSLRTEINSLKVEK